MRQPAVVNLVRPGAYWCILVLLAGLVALAGCGSQKPQVAQDRAPDNWPPAQFKVGETASDGKLAVTVTSVRRMEEIPLGDLVEENPEAPGEPLRPENQGNVFRLVGIKVENVSQAPQWYDSPHVVDIKGHKWYEGAASLSLKNRPAEGDSLASIPIGESIAGYLLYEVPPMIEHPMLRYDFIATTTHFDLTQ